LQINARIPEDDPGGEAEVRVRMSDGRRSNSLTATILPPQPVPPRITLVSNALDGGVDVYASGPKSLIRIFVGNLSRSATIENVSVRIGARSFKPLSLTFQPNNAVYLLTLQLPEDTPPQATEISVSFNELTSAAWPVQLH
jgi:hypothetical protein